MISVNQISLDFGQLELFNHISFVINPKDRIGLVGRNGAGKSTLLKIIKNIQQPTSGTIVMPNSTSIEYLPQHLKTADKHTVIEEAKLSFGETLNLEKEFDKINQQLCERTDYESEEYAKLLDRSADVNERLQLLHQTNIEESIERVLKGLGFVSSDFSRPTKEFSGGWRMRIELAKILLKSPDLILLDEPTNHLDIESIQWLEQFIKNYKGAVVLISHDRTFLNNATNRTIEISLGKIYDFKTIYSKYLKLREEQKETQLAAYNNQQKYIADTEKFIDRFRYKATKAVQVQSRIKQLNKVERIEIEEENKHLNIKFPPSPPSGKITVEAKNISKKYDTDIIKDINISIEKGDKVAFVGKNGEGKTTFAKIIMNEIDYEGFLKIGHNVKIGYFAQDQADSLDETLTVFDTIDKIAVGDIRTQIRKILGAFLFSGDDVEKKVKVLSGGERTRLALIKLLLKPVNFLLLDEPTNHLDINTKDILKLALLQFDGTLIIISHDRDFLEGLTNKVYEFKNKKIIETIGGIFEFIEKKKINSLKELEINTYNKNSTHTYSSNKEAYEKKKELNRTLKRLENSISKSEQKIAKAENKIKTLEKQIEDGDNDSILFSNYKNLKQDLEKEMLNWEKFNKEREGII